MSENVVNFPGITRLDLDANRMLASIVEAHTFERVLVIGVLENGEEFVSASAADGGTFLWDIERAKLRLLRIGDDEP